MTFSATRGLMTGALAAVLLTSSLALTNPLAQATPSGRPSAGFGRRLRALTGVAAACLLGGLTASCTHTDGLGPTLAPEPPARIAAIPCPAPIPNTLGERHLTCLELRAPDRYAQHDPSVGIRYQNRPPKINVRAVVATHEQPSPGKLPALTGTPVVNLVGGPGYSPFVRTVDSHLEWLEALTQRASLQEEADLLLIDPRGFDVLCNATDDARQCEQRLHLEQNILPGSYLPPQVAGDLREFLSLWDKAPHLVANSFGSMAALAYGISVGQDAAPPRSLSLVVPSTPWLATDATAHARRVNRALHAVIRFCESDPQCAADHPQLRSRINLLMTRIGQRSPTEAGSILVNIDAWITGQGVGPETGELLDQLAIAPAKPTQQPSNPLATSGPTISVHGQQQAMCALSRLHPGPADPREVDWPVLAYNSTMVINGMALACQDINRPGEFWRPAPRLAGFPIFVLLGGIDHRIPDADLVQEAWLEVAPHAAVTTLWPASHNAGRTPCGIELIGDFIRDPTGFTESQRRSAAAPPTCAEEINAGFPEDLKQSRPPR